jgi:hypothetical protein
MQRERCDLENTSGIDLRGRMKGLFSERNDTKSESVSLVLEAHKVFKLCHCRPFNTFIEI